MNYFKHLTSILALSMGIGFASGCKLVGEDGNGNGMKYDGGGMPPPDEQCLAPEEFKETTIYSSTTVCPGTYRGVSLRVSTDDVNLNGEGVTLDGLLAGGTAIRAENVSRLHIKGFRLKDYSTGLQLDQVTDSVIELQSYSTVGDGIAIHSANGLVNRIVGGNLEGRIVMLDTSTEISNVQNIEAIRLCVGPNVAPTYGIKIVGNSIQESIEIGNCGSNGGHYIAGNQVKMMIVSQSSDTVIENNTFNGGGIQFQEISNTSIENNTFNGGDIIGHNSSSVILRGNTISGGTYCVNLCGGGNNSNITIENNTIEQCITGIHIDICNNTPTDKVQILSNTVQYNTTGVVMDSMYSLVEGNNIINNSKKGLRVGGCGNIVRNNDLRNNGEGNDLSSCYLPDTFPENSYEGNLE